MITRRIRNACGLLSCLGILAFSGCEESMPVITPNPEVHYNRGSGRDNFHVYFSGGHMFDGESKEVTADVRPGATYNSVLTCSNDGNSDRIKIYADGEEILSYKTEENRMGGRGWYVDQTANCRSFTASSSQVVFRVETRTDSWGTWPQSLEVAINTNSAAQ